jgi:hypothetical protein
MEMNMRLVLKNHPLLLALPNVVDRQALENVACAITDDLYQRSKCDKTDRNQIARMVYATVAGMMSAAKDAKRPKKDIMSRPVRKSTLLRAVEECNWQIEVESEALVLPPRSQGAGH